MPTRRTLTLWGYRLAAAIGGVSILSGVVATTGFPPARSFANARVLALAYVLAISWAIVFIGLYWRRLDETAKEAQKFAWLAGGLLAIGLTAPVVVFFKFTGARFLSAIVEAPGDPGSYFTLGWLFLCLAQTIAFLLVWTGWWLAKR